MKHLKDILTEAIKISSKSKVNDYKYQPKTRKELYALIHRKLIKERGEDADLNDINTSEITDMHSLFLNSRFTGDISGWDVSNVTDMKSMFRNSLFDGDLSKWDVSKVKTMDMMFDNSKFTGKNGDISNWNVSNVKDMKSMFDWCPLEKNPPKWYNE